VKIVKLGFLNKSIFEIKKLKINKIIKNCENIKIGDF
jgi:hypothetical protein